MTFAYRQDFGMGNPNVAGALLALLVLAVFLTPARGRWGRCLQLVAAAAFFGCLLLTASRGALLALAIGSLAAWAVAGFPRPATRWLVVVSIVCAFTSALFGGRAIQRLATLSPSEGSTASRIAIYCSIPAMMAAAPGGWGPGRAALAYENWFQPPTVSTQFKNLLSTHGTWMVERGWGFAGLYIAAWSLALLVCSSRPICLGIVVTWAVATSLSHIGSAWGMWVLPMLAIAVALRQRYRHQQWPSPRASALGFLFCATFIGALFAVAATTRSNAAIRLTQSGLSLGEDRPKIAFFSPDVGVLGRTYGKEMRGLGPLLVITRWQDLADTPLVVLSGNAPVPENAILPTATKLAWLNPPAYLDANQRALVERTGEKHFFWGDLRSDSNSAHLQALTQDLPDSSWHQIRGRGLYLGDDLAIVTGL